MQAKPKAVRKTRAQREACDGSCEHERIIIYRIEERGRIEQLKLCAGHAREREAAFAQLAKGLTRNCAIQNKNGVQIGAREYLRAVSRLEARMLVTA